MALKRFTSLRPTSDLPQMIAALQVRTEPEGGSRDWYSIRNVSDTEAEIFIYDEIGYWGTTAADFIKDLRDIKATSITVRINSPGGDVFDGIAIHNALQRHKADVTVYVDGIAASAASFIAMAGNTVLMSKHSQMMIHDASGFAYGPADDMRKMADILDKSSNTIASMYAAKSGGTTDEWRQKMRDETWFTDQEAVDAGLADGIDGEDTPKAAGAVKVVAEAIDWRKLTEDIIERETEAAYA